MKSLLTVRYFSASSGGVGFIGLGNMGKHMASNLLKAGNQVTVFDSTALDVRVESASLTSF